jgi:anti-sigma B factor antagonist
MDLRVTTDEVGGRFVVALEGLADLSTVPTLHDELRRAVRDRAGHTVVVDIDGVIAFDDAALGLLLGVAATARENGGDLEVVCSSERLRARLRATRFDRAVTVLDAITALPAMPPSDSPPADGP